MLPEFSNSSTFFRFSWRRLFLIKPRSNQKNLQIVSTSNRSPSLLQPAHYHSGGTPPPLQREHSILQTLEDTLDLLCPPPLPRSDAVDDGDAWHWSEELDTYDSEELDADESEELDADDFDEDDLHSFALFP